MSDKQEYLIMENETTANKPRTRWWVGLIWCIIIIVVGAPLFFTSFEYVANYMIGNWVFDDIINSISETLHKKVINSEDRKAIIDNWCDRLIELTQDQKLFVHNFDGKQVDTLILNEAAAQLLIEGQPIPDDMVFMFDGQAGWNQIGGKEMMRDNYRGGIFTFVTGDLNINKIPASKINRLRWTPQEQTKALSNNSYWYINYIIAIAILAAVILTASKHRNRLESATVILWIILSTAPTLYFAYLGNTALYAPVEMDVNHISDIPFTPVLLTDINHISDIPFIPVLLTGISAGIIFAVVISSLKEPDATRRFCRLIIIGGIIGLAASCIVHTYLMIFRETTEPYGIIGGAGYGIWAGAIFGFLTHWVMWLRQKISHRHRVYNESCEYGK